MDDDTRDRLLEAISTIVEMASDLLPEEAIEEMKEADRQAFWRDWPDVSSWAGAVWRSLNEDMAEPAKPAGDPDLDESGGGG